MSDIVERLRAPAYWISGSDEGHEGDNSAPMEAARTIEILRVELAKVNMENDRLTRTNRAKREHRDKLLAAKAKDAARIEQLEKALRECEKAIDEHHAENVSRCEWSGSSIAQKKARAIAARSGVLLHAIKRIARAALEGK